MKHEAGEVNETSAQLRLDPQQRYLSSPHMQLFTILSPKICSLGVQ